MWKGLSHFIWKLIVIIYKTPADHFIFKNKILSIIILNHNWQELVERRELETTLSESLSRILIKTNCALYLSILYKFWKSIYIPLCYRIMVTYSDKNKK